MTTAVSQLLLPTFQDTCSTTVSACTCAATDGCGRLRAIHFWPIHLLLGCWVVVVGGGVGVVVVGGGVGGDRWWGWGWLLVVVGGGAPIFVFSLFSGCRFVEFWFKHRDPQMCTFGLSGCRVKPRNPPSHTHTHTPVDFGTDPSRPPNNKWID